MLNEYLDDPEHYRKFVNVIPDLFDLYDAIETEFAVAYNENGRMYGRKSYSGYKEGSPVGKSKFCMSDIYYKNSRWSSLSHSGSIQSSSRV